MKKKILLLLISTVLVSFAKVKVITINRGVVSRTPIAVHSVISDDVKLGQYLGSIIHNDLNGCGLIKSISEGAFTQKLLSLSETPKYSQWKAIGAHFLIVIALSSDASQYKAEVKIYDTVVGKMLDYYRISANKSSVRSLAHSVSDKIYSRVTGEAGYFNSKVAFVKEISKIKKNIFLMDMDGHNEIPVVTGNRTFLSPRISPDGKKLVYFSYKRGYSQYRRGGKDMHGELYMMDLHTAKVRPLNITYTGYMSYAPRFSPDGNDLVFSLSDENGGSAIYKHSLVSGRTSRLTRSVARSIDTSPCYSPDGKHIVFNSDRSGTQQLYIMSSSGGDIHRLSFGAGRYATPAWSPRGDYIAFARITEGEFYIGLIRPDGSDERMIASGYIVENPAWIKNGRMLLYTKMPNRRGVYELRMVDVTGNYDYLLKRSASDPDVGSV